ncbi:MAG TPA: hypothetical protein VHC68_00860 [Candidatus Paceibacterota bacterium]|nr:hypothetical protein [Candidatus Paceibacterota bacterium]
MTRLLPLILLAAAAGIFFGYVSPQYEGPIAAAKSTIAADNQALAAAAAYTAKENQLAAARDQIAPDDLARLTALLPTSVNNVQAILDLDNLAVRSGFPLAAINVVSGGSAGTVQGITEDQSVGSVDLSISGSGSYAVFRTFLAGVERSVRLLDVRTLSITSADSGIYSYSMTLRLYWLKS